MGQKNEFTKEQQFLDDLKNIKRKRKQEEVNLYKELISIIDNTPGDEAKKETLKKLINNLDKYIEDMNPMTFVMEVNILLSKLIFIVKSKDKNVPASLLVPYLSIREDAEVWLANMKDGIIPYLVKSNLLNKINIKG